jgi:hypothetical protein
MASAGVAVGAIMAISPVFAQGTTPSSPSNGSTLLASILAAAHSAGITLTAEQTAALAEVVAEITPNEVATANDVEDEDELDEDDDTEPATAAATAQVTKHEVKVTTSAAVTKSGEESKSDD